MKFFTFHNTLILVVLLFSFYYFTFLAQAATPNRIENSKKQMAVSLMQKAKKAILSGNYKQAEKYWHQANSLDPNQPRPIWLKKENAFSLNTNNNLPVMEEKKFIELLNNMPYEKAKIELDKRLMFNPDNSKLRLVYLELAQKNKDTYEIERHSALLGIKQPEPFNYGIIFKYIFVIILLGLIIFEIISIYKTSKK